MKFLLDTHVLLWAASNTERLPPRMLALLEDQSSQLFFSAASLWEITIKSSLGRSDFQVDPHGLRRELLDRAYTEVPVTSQHAVSVALLPPIHKDPFDRILLAQCFAEGLTLMTVDAQLTAYNGPIFRY